MVHYRMWITLYLTLHPTRGQPKTQRDVVNLLRDWATDVDVVNVMFIDKEISHTSHKEAPYRSTWCELVTSDHQLMILTEPTTYR